MNTETKTPRNKLGILESAKLLTLVQERFAASELDDEQFASYASQELGFPCAASSVAARRRELGIDSAIERARKAKAELLKKKAEREAMELAKSAPAGVEPIVVVERRLTLLIAALSSVLEVVLSIPRAPAVAPVEAPEQPEAVEA